MDGLALLRGYLAKHSMTQVTLAAQVGVPGALVSQWLSGARRPGVTLIFEIERATAGAVPARSWARPRSRRTKAAHAPKGRRPAA